MINKFYFRKDYLNFIRLTRPKQWVKNFFVFSPLVFSAKYYNLEDILNSFYCFIFFTIASAIAYIVNDIYDYENDVKHPIKSIYRPIAAGKIKINEAYIFIIILIIILFFSSVSFNHFVFIILFSYIIINFLYSKFLKFYPFVDITIISIGFILRILCGAISINVDASIWILITTFSLGIYLSSIKRYQEMNLETNVRTVFKFYNKKLLKNLARLSAIFSLIFYTFYCINENNVIFLTLPFVFLGLFRYWKISFQKNKGESPTDTILEDKYIILIVLSWIIIFVYNNLIMFPNN